ncbi:MAG: SH3 domain-containing protein [Erythrobacter sp.]
MSQVIKLAVLGAALVAMPQAALAQSKDKAKDAGPQLVTCEESLGVVALVDGDQAGWAKWGLGSPRALIHALIRESGCFTLDNPNDDTPARFLMTAIAGSEEEVDQGMELAKGAAMEGLIRSGAAGSVLRGVPFGGAALGMFGGIGGKKQTVAAGLKVVSPANGLTVAAGQGVVRKSTINFGGAGYGWAAGAANASGYQSTPNGKMLAEAFIQAFNEIVSQRELMASAPATAAPAAAKNALVAADTVMRSGPSATAGSVRSLRKGTELIPTGKREGLFLEVKDSFGTTGWVSVEDLQ